MLSRGVFIDVLQDILVCMQRMTGNKELCFPQPIYIYRQSSIVPHGILQRLLILVHS